MENETNPEPCKSLLLFIPSLTHSAGMERASTTVANALTRRGYRVAFAVLGDDTASFFPLAEGVRVYGLGNTDGVRRHRWRTARRLRRLAVRLGVDYVVNVDVSMVQVSVLALPLPRGMRLLTWEHFSMASVRGSLPARAQRWLAAVVSRRTVVLTEADRRAYPAALRGRVEVIPNFTTLNPGGARSPLEAHTVVAVGRKVAVKGFDLLIEAWRRIPGGVGDWRLRIIGGVTALIYSVLSTVQGYGRASRCCRLRPVSTRSTGGLRSSCCPAGLSLSGWCLSRPSRSACPWSVSTAPTVRAKLCATAPTAGSYRTATSRPWPTPCTAA